MLQDMESSSSSEEEEEAISPFERTFHLLKKQQDNQSSESSEYEKEDNRENFVDFFESDSHPFQFHFSNEKVHEVSTPPRLDFGRETPTVDLETNFAVSERAPAFEALSRCLPGFETQRQELDASILKIVKQEERSGAVSDLRIKEKLLEIGPPLLVNWALQKIPGPVGMYGYTSLLQKTTEMHLAIRRLIEEGRIVKKTKRTYVLPQTERQTKKGASMPVKRGKPNENGDESDRKVNRRSSVDSMPFVGLKGNKPLLWPTSVEYVPQLLQDGLSMQAKENLAEAARKHSNSLTSIGIVQCEEHLENGGWGVFAVADLPPCKVLGEYCGEIQLVTDDRMNGIQQCAMLYRNGIESVRVNAQQKGNEFRFINDYRKVKGGVPNVRFDPIPLGGEWHVLVITTKEIKRGTELLADYGSVN